MVARHTELEERRRQPGRQRGHGRAGGESSPGPVEGGRLTCPHERYHSLAQCGHDRSRSLS